MGKEKLVLFSTHILPEVAATCSRILMINQGKIVANGTLADLIEQVRSEEKVHLTIRGTAEEITPQLRDMDGVTGVSHVKTDNGVVSYEITTSQEGYDATSALYRAAQQNSWDLVELHHETIDLENIFLHFSTGENRNTSPNTVMTEETEEKDPSEEE